MLTLKEFSRKGGSARTPKKLRAIRRNLKKALAAKRKAKRCN